MATARTVPVTIIYGCLPSYYSLTRTPTFYSLPTDTASQAFLPRQVAQLEAQLAELEALLRDAAAKDEARITAAVKVRRHRSGVQLRGSRGHPFSASSPAAALRDHRRGSP